MRQRTLLLALTGILVLTACGQGGKSSFIAAPRTTQDETPAATDDTVGTTGATNKDGVPYLAGTERMTDALKQEAARPQPPATKTSKAAALKLNERVRTFEISRFANGESKPSRFGAKSYSFKVFFTASKDKSIEFKGDFQNGAGSLTIKQKVGDYSVEGTLTDNIPDGTLGDITLHEDTSGQSIRILYDAYKARLLIHQDLSQKIEPGSNLDQQLKALCARSTNSIQCEDTFGWVNNWAIVNGAASYLIDIIKVVNDLHGAAPLLPTLAFSGESLQTGDQDIPVQSLTSAVASQDLSLIGNSQEGTRRLVQVTLKDPKTNEESKVIFDVMKSDDVTANLDDPTPVYEVNPADRSAEPVSEPPVPPAPEAPTVERNSAPENPEPPAVAESAPSPGPVANSDSGASAPHPTPRQTPATQAPAAKPAASPSNRDNIVPAVINGTSYFKIDMSSPRIARMHRDFSARRNLILPGVDKYIRAFQGKVKERGYTGLDITLNHFFTYANPFRRMIESIARVYDVSPAFSYLAAIENGYFQGDYRNAPNSQSSAVGPFQFLNGSGIPNGVREGGGVNDERNYFAPSACGAANYMAQMVTQFSASDTTLAILGYNQGPGGAARAIMCTYSSRTDCHGNDWNRYINRIKNYDFDFATIDRTAAIPLEQRKYVEEYLAIHFISDAMNAYGFALGAEAPQGLPRNGSVMPPNNSIANPKCQAAISGI